MSVETMFLVLISQLKLWERMIFFFLNIIFKIQNELLKHHRICPMSHIPKSDFHDEVQLKWMFSIFLYILTQMYVINLGVKTKLPASHLKTNSHLTRTTGPAPIIKLAPYYPAKLYCVVGHIHP